MIFSSRILMGSSTPIRRDEVPRRLLNARSRYAKSYAAVAKYTAVSN
jgi:hypothetical protein